MYKTYGSNGTIREVLDAIHENKLVLPAIQREFVWRPSQICQFFDSILQGYPFGTFLFWEIEPENSHKFKWFDFVREYHERDNAHCPPHPTLINRPLTAVLDGQQRLTALNIGLQGSMANKIPYWHWSNPNAFPVKHLCLDLLADSEEDEGEKFRFEFLTVDERNRRNSKDECWFNAAKIMRLLSAWDVSKWVMDNVLDAERQPQAHEKLDRLRTVIHNTSLVNYYEESGQDIEKVLQIFIRMNRGGTPLAYSDLLLSTAVAQWQRLDARKEIHSLVDELNRIGIGFNFPFDFVLKAGMMLCDLNVRFRVANFDQTNMLKLERSWHDVKRALILTAQLASRFGFNRDNLSSNNALLPIAHYLYCLNPGEGYLSLPRYGEDRRRVAGWLRRSLMKQGVWASGQDALLTRLQRAIESNDDTGFPEEALMKAMSQLGKSLEFTKEEIDDLADMRFRDRRVYPLLSLIFPVSHLDGNLHVDHIFPRAAFGPAAMRKAGVPDEQFDLFDEMSNGIANLQLLDGLENSAKGGKMPHEWLHSKFGDDEGARREYVDRRLLGHVPESLAGFEKFYVERRERIRRRLTELLRPAPAQ